MKNVSALVLMVVGFAPASCQVVAGLEERAVDPIRSACTLPAIATGGASLRFADLVPDESAVDICVRPSGGEFGRPLLRGGGSSCPTGFTYTQTSARFGVAPGKVDVKVIKAGGTCAAPSLSTINNVTVAAGTATTIVRMGNEKTGESLKAFPEARVVAVSGGSKFRVIHASPSSPAFDVGVAASPRLPTELKTPLLDVPIAYGESTTPASKTTFGPADADGYLELPGTEIVLGAAPTGTTRATIAHPLPGEEAGRSIYFIGDPAKPYFPVRALVCEDTQVDPESKVGNSAPLRGKCVFSALGTLSIATWNAYLYGSFADDEDIRRPLVIDAVAGRDGDVMCLTAISRKKHRDDLVAKALEKGIYAYSINATATLDTQATEPNDQSGNPPVPFTTPACGGDSDQAKIAAGYNCMIANCSTTKTPEGQNAGGSSCLSEKCAGDLIPLIAGNPNEQRCFNCLVISQLSDSTLAQTKALCDAEVRPYKAFNGDVSTMVLSRYPLSDVETYVLPATGYQRVVHYAKVAIERDKFVDYFCAELTPAFGSLVPYDGYYAPDKTKDLWSQEQLLQTQRLIDYVKRKSEGRPAILTGEFAASREFKLADGTKVIDAQNPAVFDLLDGAFVPALPPGYQPRCTECATPANPYNGDLNVWQFRTYTQAFPENSGVEVNLFFTDLNAVEVSPGVRRPLSDRWGYETRVLRP